MAEANASGDDGTIAARRKNFLIRLLGRVVGALRYHHTILFLLAIVVGVGAAYAAIAFRLLIAAFQTLAFGTGEETLISGTVHLQWWHLFLAPIAGGFAVSGLLYWLVPDRRLHGVADVIEAAALRDGRMSWKTGLSTALASAAALGSGASAGREGPVVHLGATLASWTAERLRLSPAIIRTLLGCGVAAAIGASFNAPIAGVIFALEVVVGHYALHAFAPIVVAGVAGTVVSRIHLGNFPAFIVPEYGLLSVFEYPAFLLLGLVAAIVAILFQAGIFLVEDTQNKFVSVPEWLLPPIGGLCVGMIAIFFPQVLGVGYEATDTALKEGYGLVMLLSLAALKLLATTLSIGFRFGSGVFSPSLFIGAMMGGAFGAIAAMAFPEHASGLGVYTIVGMGAMASAVLGAPISTTLIIFELTGNYEVAIAVMIASAMANLISATAYERSFFLKQLSRKGLRLEGGKASYLLKSTRVKAVMDQNIVTCNEGETLDRIRYLLLAQGGDKLPVTDETGALLGVITLSELPDDAFSADLGRLVRAHDIMRTGGPTLISNDTLEAGLRLLERTGENSVIVLQDAESRTVVGILRNAEVLRAYTRALVESQGG